MKIMKKQMAWLLAATMVLSVVPGQTTQAAKAVKLSSKKVTLTVGKSKTIQLKNNKKKTTDLIHVTSSKRSVATIKNCKVSAKKITFSIHSKQIGKTKIQIKAGNRKKTLICTVKEKKTIKKKQ